MMSFQNISWENLNKNLHLKQVEVKKLRNKDFVLAFSGGADSVLSLYTLISIHRHFNIKRKIILYYLNHNQAFDIKEQEKRNFVFEYYKNFLQKEENLEFIWMYKELDINQISRKLNRSFENTGSLFRHRHIDKIVSKHKNRVSVWGHSLSDWYETLIMRLNRGSSCEKILPFNVYEKSILLKNNLEQKKIIFRPLANIFRNEVRELVKEYNLIYWDDPSNLDIDILRNKIRHQYQILNFNGLRKTAQQLQEKRKKIIKKEVKLLKEIIQKKNIISISHNEYSLKYSFFEKHRKKIFLIIQLLLQQLGMLPLSKNRIIQVKNLSLNVKPYSVEVESFYQNKKRIIIRKGQSNLYKKKCNQVIVKMFQENQILKQNKSYTIISADKISKKYFIQLQFGRKSIKKILSEKKLSQRQLSNLLLPIKTNNSGENTFEVLLLPLEVYGMKNYIQVV